MSTNDLDDFKFHLADSKTSIAESINWRCLHLSDGAIKTIKCDHLMLRVWAITGAKENVRCWLCHCCHSITVPVMITRPCHLSGEWCPRMKNWTFDKHARDMHLHITTTVPCTPFSCWDAGLAVQWRVVGIRQQLMQRGTAEKTLNPLGDSSIGPWQRPAWGVEVTDDSQPPCSPILAPTQKREMTDTSNSSGESNNNFQLQTGHT